MEQCTEERGGRALFRTVSAWGARAVSHDPSVLTSGFHAVVVTFEGEFTAVRFDQVREHEDTPWAARGVEGNGGRSAAPEGVTENAGRWESSLSSDAYQAAVRRVREHIAAGTAYQVNACRVLSTEGADVDMDGLYRDILQHNPAPYACRIDAPGVLDIVSASPELFLHVAEGTVTSSPIKGTAVTPDDMLAKDIAENIMITDLVRNDLQRVCDPGTVVVDPLLEVQQHPGLVHLVSTVRGRLGVNHEPGPDWGSILAATFPPGSVSGAPKSSALDIIDELEPTPRGPYCGAIGWVDGDTGRAELAVGIRTFWREPTGQCSQEHPLASQRLSFGTGAGITWDSDPQGEWNETQLKARRLVSLVERHRPREK